MATTRRTDFDGALVAIRRQSSMRSVREPDPGYDVDSDAAHSCDECAAAIRACDVRGVGADACRAADHHLRRCIGHRAQSHARIRLEFGELLDETDRTTKG